MIVHFVVDEKIIDQIIDNFLEISSNNLFLVFTEKSNNKFKHITREGSFIRRFNLNKEDINEVLCKVNAQTIILHQLNLYFAKVLNQIKETPKIAWFEWGFDIYHLPKILPQLYAPKTKRIIIRNNPLQSILWVLKKNSFIRRIYFILTRKDDPAKIILTAIERITYFCTYIKDDYTFFQNYYPFRNLVFLETAFSSISQYLAGNINLRINSDASNILLGNSNSLESNYIDGLSIINKNKDKIDKVYTVLSYGDDDNNKKAVLDQGYALLQDRFVPLTKFLEREKYLNILSSCSTGIFFHYRQQAMGNIIAMLYMGARIYLSYKNPAYNYFKRIGVTVFSLEDDFHLYGNTKISASQAQKNRQKLDTVFNEEKVKTDLSNLISKITS
ncbi:TDP-N-acetylfucosamine:lipid II N-acetylfucosaminyltransferase [Draconibacterium sediminis]|uniref:TDP-N-acetylfucosamine:lipid II N-acetylfucosaminyltransferase n=1 Tax=Draconibacterium sediminis TaxID=1544798 RepID=UPI0026EC039E|nr:TDP-N-acetylfucosamine:lipid II N-acetylfucosaminyltransferase [Draconibacterium sediminis]